MAAMKQMPTRGPIASSSAHHDLERTSCLHSLASSQMNGRLGEGKEDLFQIVVRPRWPARQSERLEILERALATHTAAAEEHEAVAQPRGVADLVDREKQRAPARGMALKDGCHVPRLAQIETVEGFVDEERGLWGEKPD